MSQIVRVYVGLDYHEESVRVCVVDEDGLMLINRDVENDPGAVRDLVQQLGFPLAVAIEACCGAADFAVELKRQTEWNVRLAHAGYVRQLRRSRDKTDHGDAWLLADLVRVNYLPEVWLPDEATRQLRRLVRYRQGLSAERKNIKQRIRSLLREERCRCETARAWTKAWLTWLSELSLGSESRWVLDQELARLKRIDQDMAQVESRLEEVTADDPLTQKLLEQDGVGLVTAVTLRAEIGTFDRFRTGKQLAKFCGLSPCNASTGRSVADAGLIRTGNKALRAVLIQTAQRLPRHVERWGELKRKLCQTKRSNVATAAVANRWLRWLFHQVKSPVVLAG